MVRDARWPALPLLALRGLQLLFTILVLGASGYLVSLYDGYTPLWGYSMNITAAVFTLVYVAVTFFLFFANLLLPLAIVIVDAVMTVFWAVALAGLGDTRYLSVGCTWMWYDSYGDWTLYTSISCKVVKASFGISFLLLLSFIGTLVLASIVLHKNRKDLRGAKHNSGLDPEGNPLPQANVAAPAGNVQVGVGNTYYQEPKPMYAPTPQPAATPGYYDYQHSYISPPGSPAPYTQPQGIPPQSMHPQGMQPQGMPQPPPVAAAEMAAR